MFDYGLLTCVRDVSYFYQLVKRSPKLNSQFQKLFALPSEEFLINDYACAIKKKIPIQVCHELQ